MDRFVEGVGVREGSVREMMRLEVAPDGLDVLQFRGAFGQPLETVSDAARAASAASASLLAWIWPLPSTARPA